MSLNTEIVYEIVIYRGYLRYYMKKRFSILNKFVIILGSLILTIGIALVILAIRLSRKAVRENVETYLLDKAVDTAEIIDQRIIVLF